jgi:apolipoprotein N-acyltransferase
LFEGEVYEGFVPGKAPGFFNQHGQIAGVAICKDLDYEKYIRLYRQAGASILYVPAWDFNRDGWFHSRIAMMRAVENGYSLVRNARDGRLTISDDRGRVLAEASSEDGRTGFLIGALQPSANATLYSRWGDWFGWVNLVAAVCFLLVLLVKKTPR